MNCKNCGSPMVSGQLICSNCDYVNNEFESTNYDNYSHVDNKIFDNQNFEQQGNIMNSNMYNYENVEYNSSLDIELKENIEIKQNIVLKIASILALVAGAGMLISTAGTLYVKIRLGSLNVSDLFSIIISIIMIVNAFFINNFNIRKSTFFDNKMIFLTFMGINFISGFVIGINFLIFVFSLIGFIISCKNNK